MKIIILITSLIGLVVSIYLTYLHYTTNLNICLNDNRCNLVLTSKFSQIYGIPLALIGAIYFFLFSLLVMFFIKNILLLLLLFLSFLGMIVGLILIYLQVFVIKSLCYYCLVVDVILIVLPFFIIIANRLNR